MVKIALSGACGKMGRVIAQLARKRTDCEIRAGVDLAGVEYDGFPVFKNFFDIQETDVVIDFSHPDALSDLLSFCKMRNKPAVIATTGYSDGEIAAIKAASEQIPVFFSFNMSLGINLLIELSKKAAKVLGRQFDVEIIERHHNTKKDAPSGTAIMLADAINQTLSGGMRYIYDRHTVRKEREPDEIGMHAVRGGSIVGDHTVIFAGHDEVIELSHSAASKEVFSVGALNAAVFLAKQKKGLYNMADLLNN
ncbi:MAG: 4-hydroxy-tetrahydrodipicolinate reductase [Oscillospiraceae bacterium]|nr:4-hydroxy-tetrahydrodipicolinate reductase [Oscillospiraceae bacterium]